MYQSARIALVSVCLSTGPAALTWAQDVPSPEEMWAIIQQQQQEIEALRSRLGETEAMVEATGDMVEEVADQGLGAAEPPGWWDRTHIGGYGELHYNGGDVDEIDFHRFVLFIDHEFNDKLHFVSELEVEHAFTGTNGDVELEQAYLEYSANPYLIGRAGLFLVPVGLLNETHEPDTFFGVERNRVETDIIPTTWWEAGVGSRGEIAEGFSYDLSLHSGLNVPISGSNAFRIRSGRQKVSEAIAKDGAVTGRIKWTGMPGIELAVTGQYQNDITQNQLGIGATLIEGHADIRRGPWGFRALYARWDLEEGPSETGPGRLGRDIQYGWYVEPSYRFGVPGIGGPGELGFFARYSERDTAAGSSLDTKIRQLDIGTNYWPHPHVVLKADWQQEFRPDGGGKNDNRLNLGVGYQF